MKNTTIFAIIMLIIITGNLYANDFRLENIPADFIGTYIPVQYDNLLKVTRSHYEAMLSSQDLYHDILLLTEDTCYSNEKFHDGYAIRRVEFDQYSFVIKQSEKFLIDEKGNSYRKISNNIGTAGYSDFGEYVLNTIFEDIKEQNYISIENDSVIIDGIEFSIHLDYFWLQTEDVSLWLRSTNGMYALVMEGLAAKLYEGDGDGFTLEVSEEYLFEFPLFFWNDDSYPDINISNGSGENLRYLRNLIFAKHGYVFRSEELRTFFEGFSWYNQNPSFTQDDFTAAENRLLERIIEFENG